MTDFISCHANGGKKLHHNIIIYNKMGLDDIVLQLNTFLVPRLK